MVMGPRKTFIDDVLFSHFVGDSDFSTRFDQPTKKKPEVWKYLFKLNTFTSDRMIDQTRIFWPEGRKINDCKRCKIWKIIKMSCLLVIDRGNEKIAIDAFADKIYWNHLSDLAFQWIDW